MGFVTDAGGWQVMHMMHACAMCVWMKFDAGARVQAYMHASKVYCTERHDILAKLVVLLSAGRLWQLDCASWRPGRAPAAPTAAATTRGTCTVLI